MKQYSTNRLWGRMLAWTLAAALLFSNLEGVSLVHAEGEKATAIGIGSAEDLQKIGTDEDYPMTGDYVLTDDIDLSGIKWEPMGGHIGDKGSCNPAQANVFSGTFDGQGHVISGMTIDLNDSINVNGKYGQVGLFAVIGSNNASDYAEVKNLIFTDVNIRTDFPDGLAAVGTLAGEVNGYAKVSGIVVVDGSLTVNPSVKCNTVGAGGIIGECRTADSGIKNNYISVTDCYNGADVRASGTESKLEYAGGIIGRVTESACKEISRCVNTGEVLYCGYDGYGIIAAANKNIDYAANLSNSYFRAVTEQREFGNVTALSDEVLTSGTLPEGLQGGKWRAEKGAYPFPSFCYDSSAAGLIYLSSVSLGFAKKESAAEVKTEIELPQKIGEHVLTWESSNSDVLAIDDDKAVAKRDLLGTDTVVTLTAKTPKAEDSEDFYSRSFQVTVLAGDENKPSFQPGYAKEGEKLTVSIPGIEEGQQLTYVWKVDGTQVSTEDSYTPTASDMEKFLSVTVTGEGGKHWELSMYCSELPVVYVDTADGQGVTNKNIAKDATLRIQGNEEFSDTATWYQGETTIKGRGNSTWDYAYSRNLKLPYKLKLDSKANLLGIGTGANKHWVLLANMIDHTNMRNEIANNFAKGIGMETTVSDTGVVLILNGEYQGMYELAEHVRVGAARVPVFEWEDLADEIAKQVCKKEAALDKSTMETYLEENLGWATTGTFEYSGKTYVVSDYYKDPIPAFTGGFLLDMDFRSTWDKQKYISTFQTKNGIPMFFRAPEYAVTNSSMVNFAKEYMDAYESAIGSADFTADYKGDTVHYTDLFDMDSLLQYWLLCEYVNNWDSMKNSTYLYKDLEGKAKMGPAWDYDWAWGNINMYSMTGPFVYDNWHTTLCGMGTNQGGFAEQGYQREQWNRYLVKDPYFVTRAWEYYQKYKDTLIADIMKDDGLIDTLEAKYATAAEKNDRKWAWSYGNYEGKAFVNGNVQSVQSQTYHEAVASLKTFITKRMAWMDEQFTDVDTLYKSLGNTVSNQISVVSPTDGTDGIMTVTAEVKDSNATAVVFLVNGIKVLKDGEAKIPVSGGKASVTFSKDMLLGNMRNTVEVLGVSSSGNYIAGLMNFTTFKGPQVRLDGTVEVSSDRKGDKSYPGDTLTAKATITGDIKGNLTYQWYAGDEAIKGATKSSYQLTSAEIGKTVSVKVGSTVEAGTLGKVYDGAVEEKPTVLEGTVKITSSRDGDVSYPGDTLTVKVSNENNTGKLSYQWYADGNKIQDATKKSYELTNEDIGKKLSIKVKSDEQSGTLEQTYAGEIMQNPDPEVSQLKGTVNITAQPVREGNVSYPGDTLSAAVSEDCNYTGTLSYQWYAGEEAITGATESAYVLTEEEIGKEISVKVTSSVQDGTISKEYAGTVTEKPKTALTGTVEITAEPKREGNVSYPGDTLKAVVSEDCNHTGTLSYQWYAGGEAITGATESAYVLTEEEIGKTISVKVTSTEETGEISKPYAGTVARKQEKPDPVQLTGTVTVTSSRTGGESYPGDTLTVTVSGSNNSGTPRYQWYAGDKAITGAVTATYVLTDNEIGKKLTVEVQSSVETGKIIGTYNGTIVKETIKATSIKLSVTSKKLYAYQTLQLTATMMPKEASQSVEYSSDKKSVATVSKTGKITAQAPGTANITVKTKDGSGLFKVCKITVLQPVIKVSGKTSVKRNKSITLTAKTYGLKGTVKWKLDAKGKKLLKLSKSSGSKVKLTAKKKTGTAKLTITCGKKKITKTIRVKK